MLNVLVPLACAALCALLPAARADVITLTGDSFHAELEKHDFLVVKFYAPWCGHCKRLAPEYEQAATLLKDTEIALAKVDATEEGNKKLAEKNGEEHAHTYKGPRDADGIVDYLKKQSGPAVHHLQSKDEVEKAKANNDLAIIAYVPDHEAPLYKSYLALAKAMRQEFVFHYVTEPTYLDLKLERDDTYWTTIRIFKAFEDGAMVQLTGKNLTVDPNRVRKFVAENCLPAVVELNKDPKNRVYIQRLFADPAPKAMLFVHPKEDEHKIAKLRDAMNDAAHRARPAEIERFLRDHERGVLDEAVKSEKPPESNDGAVTVVVASQFEELVVKPRKDVLIEFYAPWCAHCKKLAPIYEEVGEEFRSDPTVTVAKMDATENDVPSHFHVRQFPTIYHIAGATGKMQRYAGARTKADLVKFVRDSASGEGSRDEL